MSKSEVGWRWIWEQCNGRSHQQQEPTWTQELAVSEAAKGAEIASHCLQSGAERAAAMLSQG